MRPLALTWRDLTFPAGFAPEHVMVFTRLLTMRPLHGWWRQPDPLVCEVTGTPGALRWRLGMTTREAGMLLPQLRAQLPQVTIQPTERDLPPLAWAIELRLNNHTHPLRTDVPDAVAAAVLTAIRGVYGNEALVLSWVIGPWLPRPAVRREQGGLFAPPPLDPDEVTAIRAKFTEPLLGAVGRIGVRADTPARQTQLAQRVLGALEIARAPGVAFVVRRTSPRGAADRLARHTGPLWHWPCPLNAAELSAVLGWPIGNPFLDGVTYRGHRQLPAAAGNWVPETTAAKAPPGRYRMLGRSVFPGRAGFVHLPISDALHHLWVVGPTGTGKSALLAHLIEADIAAGRSVVVVEPKADLIAAVVDRIPEHRTDEVVLLDPADPDYAVGLNVLAGDPELAADRFVDVVRNLYRDSWGPRTSQVLHAAALTLARAGETLADLAHLLTNPTYRDNMTARTADPLGTGPFWAWFAALSDNKRDAVIGPSLNKLGAFTARRSIRAVIGQPHPSFELADVFTGPPRVLLVNLARGLIGPESARLLGALVLSQLWQTALGRAAIPPDRRKAVAVYIDEFHEYAAGLPLDFGDVLSQARGLGLALTVAHQGLHQLDPTTRAGVIGHARSRLVFQTAAPDTDLRALAASLGQDITPTDIAALGAWEGYATLIHNHAAARPASLVTLPPQPSLGTADTVRARSRQQWATPVADVEAAILARRQPDAGTGRAVGHRRLRRPT